MSFDKSEKAYYHTKYYKGAKKLTYFDAELGNDDEKPPVLPSGCAVIIKSDGLYLDYAIRNASAIFSFRVFKVLPGKISDFEVYTDSDGITHILCLKEYKETNSDTVYNKLVGVTFSSDYKTKTVKEYGIRVSTGNIFRVGDYFGSKKTASIELNGQWIQIEGANTDTLTITGIPLEVNGALIRCEFEDKDGETIVSENAVLRANKIPGTGDVRT